MKSIVHRLTSSRNAANVLRLLQRSKLIAQTFVRQIVSVRLSVGSFDPPPKNPESPAIVGQCQGHNDGDACQQEILAGGT